MKISILTLFPEMFTGPFDESILKIAKEKKLLEINLVNIRDFGFGKHKMVDDTPYGGGRGMVMRVDVLYEAIQQTRDKSLTKNEEQVILMDARGVPFSQKNALSLKQYEHLIILCGHYEGVDERIRSFVDQTLSIGDFILTGGEIPAMLITDAVARLLPGVLTDEATAHESFSYTTATNNRATLEYPQYTKPREFQNMHVPEVILSGNHAVIDTWRKTQAEKLTKIHRPDLLSAKTEDQ